MTPLALALIALAAFEHVIRITDHWLRVLIAGAAMPLAYALVLVALRTENGEPRTPPPHSATIRGDANRRG